MPHKFINIPNGIVLSSSIEDIIIETENNFVDFAIIHDDGKVVLSERFYAYANRVTISNVASLLELELRNRDSSFEVFRLQAYSQSKEIDFVECSLPVLYCDRAFVGTDNGGFAKNNFLSAYRMQRIAKDSIVNLSMLAMESESLEYSVFACYRNKDTLSDAMAELHFDTGLDAESTGVNHIYFSTDNLLGGVAKASREIVSNIELVHFTVYCGNRSASFFIDDSLSNDSAFFFKNCFNVTDSVFVPGLTTTKSTVDRSLAVINGRVRFYDQTATDSHEVNSAGLQSFEAECISQLFASRTVWRMVRNAYDDTEPWISMPVLITDSTCEISDSDEALSSVKFTWRYSHERQYFMPKASSDVFDSNFNPAFS